jgi:hypothetical protein
MPRRFVTLDVFTGERFAGNPLAVVLEAEGLDTAAMQQIAKEFNLSETVFVLPPSEPRQRADIRIFTPARELPFAGHPTVGTAVLLALLDQNGEPGAAAFGLKEQVGIVPCAVEVKDATNGTARFRNVVGRSVSIRRRSASISMFPAATRRVSLLISYQSHRLKSWRVRSPREKTSTLCLATAIIRLRMSIRAWQMRTACDSAPGCSAPGWALPKILPQAVPPRPLPEPSCNASP